MKAVVCILVAAVWTAPLSAQDTTLEVADSAVAPRTHPYRSSRRALILGSLIPGAGHIYAGEYWHGVLNYEGTVGTIGAGVMTFIVDKCMLSFLSTTRCDSGPQWPHQVLGVAVVGLGVWGGYRALATRRVRRSARTKGTVAKRPGPSRSSKLLVGRTAIGALAL